MKHVHLVFLHQVSDHDGGRARHASVAVDEDGAAALERRLDKLNASGEVLCKVFPGHVHRIHNLVLQV